MTQTPEWFLRLALGLGLFAFGWILFRFGINAVGFGLGYLFGFSLYELLLELIPTVNSEWMKFLPQHPFAPHLFGVIFGIVGIFLARRVYIAIAFVGVFFGILYLLYGTDQRGFLDSLFATFGILEPLNNNLGNLWPAILALVIAAIVVISQRQIIILLTACIGSYIISTTMNIPVIFLPLCFVGILLQQSQKRTKKKVVVEKEE